MSRNGVPLDPTWNQRSSPPTVARLPRGNQRGQGGKSWKATGSRRQPSHHVTPPSVSHESRMRESSTEVNTEAYGFLRTSSPDSDGISMTPNVEDATPPATSPTKRGSQGATTELRGLSLDDKRQATSKRAAPTDSYHWADAEPPLKLQNRSPLRPCTSPQPQPVPEVKNAHHVKHAVHHDSTYYSRSSTLDTKPPRVPRSASTLHRDLHEQTISELTPKVEMEPSTSVGHSTAVLQPATGSNQQSDVKRSSRPTEPHLSRWQPAMQKSSTRGYSGMILQPDSSPISEEQLAAEIRGIYDGVVAVEVKCIDIDAALARDHQSQLGVEQWQALIALHRTLLYEHHDFLMATQHPSASENLKALATKYSMPARMWKHGIHAFLEVLRHRRPDSQDYMLAFVVLAYQMMALLFETVPCFTDTWIECLGDLARYRMAIEDDREMHAVWGGVAARWYTLASDRHPDIGRLYHHLGILERPSMRKLASYAKSLTCSIPFLNARDSMTTFCQPIVQEEHLSKSNVGSAEASLVTFFALVFLSSEVGLIQSTATSGLQLLSQQPSTKTKEFGPQLVLASVAAEFEFGSAHNILTQSFSMFTTEETRSARPSEIALPGSTNNVHTSSMAATSAIPQVTVFYFACFNTVTRPQHSTQSYSDVLASVHIVLAWFHSLHSLGSGSQDQSTHHTIGALMDPDRFSWGGLCLFLNGLCKDKPIDESVFESARQGSFPGSREPKKLVPLAEDYWMRGLLWAQLYLPKDLLPARADEIESSLSGAARMQRVQWLALSLAFRTGYMKYDVHKKAFLAHVPGPMSNDEVSRTDSMASVSARTEFAPSSRSATCAAPLSVPTSPTSTSRSSTTMSTAEDSDGYTMVPRQKSKPGRSWANVAAAPPKKARAMNNTVRMSDTDEYIR